MTETGFGGGGYRYTLASVPPAPLLEEQSSESIRLTLGPDENPEYTEYAIENMTGGSWVGTDGGPFPTPAWQTHAGWGTVTATGLLPDTLYAFRVKARNRDLVETDAGPSAQVMTWCAGAEQFGLSFTVAKATSTVSAPAFMRGLDPDIRIAGKNLQELGFVVDTISGLESPRVVPDEELVPGGHTWRVWDEYFTTKRIVLAGHVHSSSPADLRLRLAYLKSFLSTFEGDPWRSSERGHCRGTVRGRVFGRGVQFRVDRGDSHADPTRHQPGCGQADTCARAGNRGGGNIAGKGAAGPGVPLPSEG